MAERRILSIWFPRLGVERAMRARPLLMEGPFALVAEDGGRQVLSSISLLADRAGLRRGMALADARAMVPGLLTQPSDPLREAAFLAGLCRWAGRFSPWTAISGSEALVLDITGCARLFGGEAALATELAGDCAGFGLTAFAGIAGTQGAAWAVARFGGAAARGTRSGDAIDQEARATRSRAQRRVAADSGPESGPGSGPESRAMPEGGIRIVPPGEIRSALFPLPLAALRLAATTVEALARLGLFTIGDIAGMPRGALARRFGTELTTRLDQALGVQPEPVSALRPQAVFALRLTLPEPVGLESDIRAAIDRLLPPLCERLQAAGRGARRLRLSLVRTDHGMEVREIGLARPADDPARIAPLFALQLGGLDAGFGFEVIRLEATVTEPLHAVQHRGHLEAARAAEAKLAPGGGAGEEALLNRIGTRVGMEAITRFAPGDSHIPEKSYQTLAAAWSGALADWPAPVHRRPATLLGLEVLTPLAPGRPPARFRWRRREMILAQAEGPERIAPEWWLDDPAWRSGARDYWRVETDDGTRLWLCQTLGEGQGNWFVQGDFG
jgi:protein ImuB